MKIYARTRDEIIKDRENYNSKLEEYQRRNNESAERYQAAEDAILDPIVDEVTKALRPFNLLDFDVKAFFEFNSKHAVKVDVRCNQNRLHNDDTALSWNWGATLDKDYNVKKESGSWSGLQATTEEQIQSLEQSLDAIKTLNNFDWATILNKPRPDYYEFVDKDNVKPEKEYDYDNELLLADLEESVIDRPVAVKLNERRNTWALIKSDTPKFFKYRTIDEYTLDRYKTDDGLDTSEALLKLFNEGWFDRIKKAKMYGMIKKPLEILE